MPTGSAQLPPCGGLFPCGSVPRLFRSSSVTGFLTVPRARMRGAVVWTLGFLLAELAVGGGEMASLPT